jgi:toxin FitB
MFVLDTNVVSELRRPGRAHPNVVAWASRTPVSQLFLSAITVLELELGALLLARRDDVQGQIIRAWLDGQVLPSFAGRVLPVDTHVALRCAHLHVPDPRAERDSLIAATALVHAMTIVTRNVADFASSGVRVINPWEASD